MSSTGTRADNNADKVAKGRHATGERSSRAKLTAEQVREIRRRYALGETNVTALGREYGMSRTATRALLLGRTWKEA